MIDTHCHIDLYPNPVAIANECERLGVITIGVTNLPSHFELGYPHLKKYSKVRLALGMHPMEAKYHRSEFPIFIKNISNTSYIGEVGLDFSREGISSKEIQVETFGKILSLLNGQPKILSIHSRRAESTVLEMLINNNIRNAIFHWYSGPTKLIQEIINAGYYFSINTAMINSKHGQEVIRKIPKTNILTETDGPFIKNNGEPVRPSDVNHVVSHLAFIWQISEAEAQRIIMSNFKTLISNLKIHA